MGAKETTPETNEGKRGFHPLILWGLTYVILTYAYPVFWYLTIPKVDDSVTSDAAYREAAIRQNGAMGESLPLVFLVIPVLLLIVNVILGVSMKNTSRRHFLNAVRIIKYLLIPFYGIGAVMIVALFLLMFTPIVIMAFVSPIVIAILSVMGWFSVAGAAPLMIAYLVKSVKDGKNGKLFAVVVSILQFFFAVDVITTIICAIKDRK